MISNNKKSASSSSSVKILKSYYKRDVCESVSKSFLLDYYATNQSNGSISSVSSSLSSNSATLNSNNNSNKTTNDEQKIKLEQTDSQQKPPSCILFVNKLVDLQLNDQKIFKEITVTASDCYDGFEDECINTSTASSTQPNSTSSQNIIQIGYKILNKIIDHKQSSSSSSSLSHSNSQTKMFQNNELHLLNNKKLRKLLPFNSGLKNHGNTCFMNCVLQCLFHTSPLADFFITDQFQRDMQFITHHEKFNQLQQQHQSAQPIQHSNLPQFILTKHFYRLLTSMWRNSYDSNYSAELKHLIGYMNPTFSGGNQNDSHELCVWLLDKLSQELTIRIETPISPQLLLNNAQKQQKSIQSLSFIEELFQVQFKSTVICSKCNYQSSKYETDMMLSLPLPQHNNKQKVSPNNTGCTKQTEQQKQIKQRRSLYAHLILSNQPTIKQITQETDDESKSKFYVNPNESVQTNLDDEDKLESRDLIAPFHVKIGVNIQITNSTDLNQCANDSSCSSVSSTTSSISSTSSASSSSSCCTSNQTMNRNSTVLNPTIGDLRRYVSATYQLRYSDLVFIDLNRIQLVLNDNQSIKDNFLINKYNDFIRTNIIDSMCIVELNCPTVQIEPQMPLINVIGINVYYETPSPFALNQQVDQQNDSKPGKKCICYGLPFALLINRDCSYSDLCKKLLEAQFKYFKDKIMLKYKDLVEKLFTLSLNDPETHERVKLNPNDELPLYAECVEKFISTTIKISKINSCVEYIKLNIEWRSFEDISNLFKDIDSGRPEYIHKSVRLMHNLDESELNNKTSKTSLTNLNPCHNTDQLDSSIPTKLSSATLNDCFELFTQREELTDENSWMCPKCKKQTNASKKLCISSVPPILIIHLKRFFYKSKSSNFKLTTPVWFPICNLDISKHITQSSKSSKRCNEDDDFEAVNDENSDLYNQSYVYDLFAVCNHKGQNMANGHYTAFCKNLIDTRWYCFDDSQCTPLVEPANTSPLNQNGSTAVCTENAYILFYKKRNCMRNEKWWIDYVDRSLLDSDEFDRFVANLDLIEAEQQKYQVQQQSLQLKQKQQQIIQEKTHTLVQSQPVVNFTNLPQKKTGGLKTLRKLWSNNKPQTPINVNNNQQNDELVALRNVLYNQSDQCNTTNYTENYSSSNNTSVDSELVAINRQAELQRIQQKRFEEAISTNYYLNKQVNNNNGTIELENQYNETVKPSRLNKYSPINQSRSGDSINENESVGTMQSVGTNDQTVQSIQSSQPTPVPMPKRIVYNNEFKKPYNGFMNEYKIPVPPMAPTPNHHGYKSPLINEMNLNASLESNERYYLNLNNNNYNAANNASVRTNDDDLTTTEEINFVSSYHNNQSSSNFSTVDSLLSYPSDNEYTYNQNVIQPAVYNANLVQEYIINSSKAFYMSNNANRAQANLTPIQEHQLIIKNPVQSPPYYQQKSKPVAQPRSNLKNNQQNNGNRYVNSNSIETPI